MTFLPCMRLSLFSWRPRAYQVTAVLLCGGGSGRSDDVGCLLAERFFATVSLLDAHILMRAAEMVLYVSGAGGRVAAAAAGGGEVVRIGGMRWLWERLGTAPAGVDGSWSSEMGDEAVAFAMRALARAFGKSAADHLGLSARAASAHHGLLG